MVDASCIKKSLKPPTWVIKLPSDKNI